MLEAWAGTFRNSRYAGCISNDQFYDVTYKTIAQLLTRGTKVTVVTPEDRPGQVLGWVAHEQDRQDAQPVVHYLFVKGPFRRRGIGRLLMDHIGATKGSKFIYTFATSFAKHFVGGYHMPSIARRAQL